MRNKGGSRTKINILMNIDSYFGEHRGRLMPFLMFFGISIIPIIIYMTLFIGIIPLKIVLILEVLFAGRIALLTLGKENEKLAIYMSQMKDEYAVANDLWKVMHVHQNGMIEYMNGKVVFLVTFFVNTYFDEDQMAFDLEDFLEHFNRYEYDVYCHLVVDEYRLQDNLENMQVYTEPEMIKERVNFYIYQDSYSSSHTELYRVTIALKTSKYTWKKLLATIESALGSADAQMFKECKIADRDEAIDIMSRDTCTYIDSQQMMENKYKNENYYGSEVLYYGDEVPEEFKPVKEKPGIEKRRVVQREGR